MKSKILLFLSILHSFTGFQALFGMQEQERVASLQKLSLATIANYLLNTGFDLSSRDFEHVRNLFGNLGEAYSSFYPAVGHSMLYQSPKIRQCLYSHYLVPIDLLKNTCRYINGLALDGNRLAVIQCFNQVVIWNLSAHPIRHILVNSNDNIKQIELREGILYALIKGFINCKVARWNITNGQAVALPSIEIDRSDLFATDGKLIAFCLHNPSKRHGQMEYKVRFWDIPSERLCDRYNGVPFRVTALKFYTDDTVISGNLNGDILIWNIRTGEILHHAEKSHENKVKSIDLDKDHLISTDGTTVCVWNWNFAHKSLQLLYRFKNDYVDGVSFVGLNNNGIFLGKCNSQYIKYLDLAKSVEIDNALAEINDPLQVLLLKKIVDCIDNGNEFQIYVYSLYDQLFTSLPQAIQMSLKNSKKIRFKAWD